MRGDQRSGERGTAVTETILLTWIMLVFFAAAYQMFIVNETIYRAMVAVHAELFKDGFAHNCYRAEEKCWHNTDKHAHVIWREQTIPEVRIITVNMFKPFGLTKTVLIQSNVRPAEPSKGCPLPCKKTKMGAGAGGPSTHYTKSMSRPWDFGAVFGGEHSLYGKAIWGLTKLDGEWFGAIDDRLGF
jgi:hypothetical protein